MVDKFKNDKERLDELLLHKSQKIDKEIKKRREVLDKRKVSSVKKKRLLYEFIQKEGIEERLISISNHFKGGMRAALRGLEGERRAVAVSFTTTRGVDPSTAKACARWAQRKVQENPETAVPNGYQEPACCNMRARAPALCNTPAVLRANA